MITSQPTPFLSEIIDGSRIPDEKLNYFRARLKNRLHAMVLTQFIKLVDDKQFTKADLARRLGKKPEQITRWLGVPGNWTLDTVSDLLLGMGFEPTLATSNLAQGAIQPSKEQWKFTDVDVGKSQSEIQQLANITPMEDSKVIDLVPRLASKRDQDMRKLERIEALG